MQGFFHAILSIIVAVMIQGGVSGAVDTPPEDAVTEFMTGLTTGDEDVLARYMDNEYVNFIIHVEGDEKTTDRMVAAIFENFEYEESGTAEKGRSAVVKVKIKTNDFSKVMNAYDKASYKYVMDNLYEDEVTDKKKLNAKCLDLYVEQIERAAEKKPTEEKTLYMPMISDGYGGWKLLIDDEQMKAIMGNLAMPE